MTTPARSLEFDPAQGAVSTTLRGPQMRDPGTYQMNRPYLSRFVSLGFIVLEFSAVHVLRFADSVERVTDLAVEKGGILSSLAVFKDGIFFTTYDGPDSIALWQYDGERAMVVKSGFRDSWERGSVQRAEMPALYSSIAQRICATEDQLYFTADDGTHGQELWKYDGHRAQIVSDVCEGPSHSNPNQLTPCNEKIYFVANIVRDGWISPTVCQLETDKVKRFAPDESIKWNLDVRRMTAFEGAVYFWAYHDEYGTELWKCDGKRVEMVENYCPDDRGNLPTALFVFDSGLYLATSGPNHCADLARFRDGKIAPVSDLGKEGLSCPMPRVIGVLNGKLYFVADISHRKAPRFTSSAFQETTEICEFDGNTVHRCVVVDTELRIPRDRFCSVGAASHGNLYFGLGMHEGDGELWRTDGFKAEQLADIWAGEQGSQPDNFVTLNDKLYFLATDEKHGRQLWRITSE